MTDIVLTGSTILTQDDLFDVFIPQAYLLAKRTLGESARVGRSLDAIYDLLTDGDGDIRVYIYGCEKMFASNRQYYDRFMKMLRAARIANDRLQIKVYEEIEEMELVDGKKVEKLMKTSEIGYGKINLSLDVTGKLENGYHLVKMVMASVSLYDELIFTRVKTPGIALKWAQDTGKNLSLGEDNLIVKAARRILLEENQTKRNGEKIDLDKEGLEITLSKNIPMAAGMAGGSADAAATLRGLNRLYGLNLSAAELCEIGVKLGADVPFCVLQGCYLSEGIGEVLTRLPNLNESFKKHGSSVYIALIKPPIDVSTKYVYEHLDTEGVDIHPDVDGQIDAIKKGDIKGMAECMRNVLRDVTVPAYPIVLELEEFLKENGALNAMMSGSGPTVFGIFDDKEKMDLALTKAQFKYSEMFISGASFI